MWCVLYDHQAALCARVSCSIPHLAQRHAGANMGVCCWSVDSILLDLTALWTSFVDVSSFSPAPSAHLTRVRICRRQLEEAFESLGPCHDTVPSPLLASQSIRRRTRGGWDSSSPYVSRADGWKLFARTWRWAETRARLTEHQASTTPCARRGLIRGILTAGFLGLFGWLLAH